MPGYMHVLIQNSAVYCSYRELRRAICKSEITSKPTFRKMLARQVYTSPAQCSPFVEGCVCYHARTCCC